jgi:AmmeMemoRadiSam system protein B
MIRAPVAAGRFYPAGPAELGDLVDRLLLGRTRPPLPGRLRALVVPHAGYSYSGAVAAAAFALLPPRIELHAAILGPSHFVPLAGAAVSGADAWRTPLGDVPLDDDLRAAAVRGGAAVDDEPHRRDHALEVELPFLQRRTSHGLRILPVAIGRDGADVVASLAETHALLVVSTDLSHHHDDATARRLDRATADAVAALNWPAVRDRAACGAAALRAVLHHGREAGWTCTLLDLRTSADATGDRRSVVGYGAFALTSR